MPNNDLISRAAAIDAIVSVTAFLDAEYIKNLCQNPANSEDWLGGVCDAINAVEDVNAVEAVPVRYGHWINRDGQYECSECHNISCCRANYCPDCGSMMIEGEQNATDRR